MRGFLRIFLWFKEGNHRFSDAEAAEKHAEDASWRIEKHPLAVFFSKSQGAAALTGRDHSLTGRSVSEKGSLGP